MDSVNHILDKYVDEYLAETETPFTKEELFKYTQHILPIKDGEVIIGMVGLDIFPSQHLKEQIPVVKIIYISPEHRKPTAFRGVIADIMTGLKEQGFHRIEVMVNSKLNNWFRRELHSKPRQYSHLQELDFFINQLVGE